MAEDIVFEPGTPIRLELLDGPELPPVQAKIVHHTGIDIHVDVPAGLEIPDGMPVHGEVAVADGLYEFDTMSLGPAHSVGTTVALSLPAMIERTQRRAFTRVADTLAVSLILRDGERISSISSTTFDVSIGGCSLLSPREVQGAVTLVLVVPSEQGGMPKRLRLDGEVRRAVALSERTWRIAIAFAELSVDEEQTLSQYLFRRMRELRRAKAGRR
jgi:c-di-GMP-binding flagellar brake protein YcgR